jgi:hypothetical protein
MKVVKTTAPGQQKAMRMRYFRADHVRREIKYDREPFRQAPRVYVLLGRMNTRVITGQEDLAMWTTDELVKGRKGKVGRGLEVVPKAIHDELVARTMKEAKSYLQSNLKKACKAIVEIIEDPMAEDSDKLKAVQMLMDRVLGKPKETVELTEGIPKWLGALTSAIVPLQGDASPIVDGEVIEEEVEEDAGE